MYDFISIDFETANEKMNSACSVGIAAVLNGEIVKTYYSLIKPPTGVFNPNNTEIHHLTYDDVKDSPTFDQIWSAIQEYIQDSHIVIAHNAQFDMSVLYQAALTYNIHIDDFIYLDSMSLTRELNCKNSLDGLSEFFNIKCEEHHNSLCDAVTLARIILEYVNICGHSLYSCACMDGGKLKAFSNLNANVRFISKKSSYKKQELQSEKINPYYLADPKTLVADESKKDESHLLFGQKCVFTGELHKISRIDAMQKVIDIGGIIVNSVSKKTNFLILGDQNPSLVGSDGMSSKERNAKKLMAQGVDIKILREEEFLSLFE